MYGKWTFSCMSASDSSECIVCEDLLVEIFSFASFEEVEQWVADMSRPIDWLEINDKLAYAALQGLCDISVNLWRPIVSICPPDIRRKCPRLREISIFETECRDTRADMDAMLRELEGLPTLRSLGVNFYAFDTSFVEPLTRLLTHPRCKIEMLSLSEDAQQYFQCSTGNSDAFLRAAIGSKLTTLLVDTRHNIFLENTSLARELFAILKHVEFSIVSDYDGVLSSLAACLLGADSLTGFRINNLILDADKQSTPNFMTALESGAPNLRNLWIQNLLMRGDLDPNVVHHFADAVKGRLQTLVISVLTFNMEAGAALFSIMAQSPTLRNLAIVHGKVSFARNKRWLAKLEESTIEKLSLMHAGLDDSDAMALAAVLKHWKHLRVLDLSYNCIGNLGIDALAEAMEEGMPALTHVNLLYSNGSEEAHNRLKLVQERVPRIQMLCYGSNMRSYTQERTNSVQNVFNLKQFIQ